MLNLWIKGPRARRALVFASATHVWNDLFFALYVPLLPLIKADPDLDLSFTEVALLKSVFSGASAALQVPAGYLAERVGEFWLLICGNIWVAAGLIGMAAASSYTVLLAVTLVGGLGGGTQHPVASSMVSRAYEGRGRATAVGAVNFTGDLGKMVAPVVALLVAVAYGWRATMRWVGLAAILFMGFSVFVRRGVDIGRPMSARTEPEDGLENSREMGAFITLSLIGFLDSGARGAALTFLPFIMEDKGLSISHIYMMLVLLMAGGAVGKFLCGWLNDRYGSVVLIWGTKGLTALLLLATLPATPLFLALLMVPLGIGLNGTSSVLYATVASFIQPDKRARMYGYFYTTNEGGTFLVPIIYGWIADLASVRVTTLVMGLVTAAILPASLALRRYRKISGVWQPYPEK